MRLVDLSRLFPDANLLQHPEADHAPTSPAMTGKKDEPKQQSHAISHHENC